MPQNSLTRADERRRRRDLVTKLAALYVWYRIPRFLQLIEPLYLKERYHDSALTGHDYVQELLHGHPERIKDVLGVRLHLPQYLAI